MKKHKILFICLGNICRSPSAEALMLARIKKEGMEEHFHIDSAGIGGWHIGDLPDKRMRKHAERRGYELISRARKFYPEQDFTEFDMIIGMDDQNIKDLKMLAKTEEEEKKIYKMTEFCSKHPGHSNVPDPYFGEDEGFELVLDLLEDAVEGLYKKLIPNK